MLQAYRTNLTSSEIILVSHVKHILAVAFCQQVDVNASPLLNGLYEVIDQPIVMCL